MAIKCKRPDVTCSMEITNSRIIPSWMPFIRIAIDELRNNNIMPAITILEEIQPLITFIESHADEDGNIHVT